MFQSGLSIFMFPIMTYILGPREYGMFALVSALMGIGMAIAYSTVSFIFYAHYPVAKQDEREHIISTLVLFLLGMIAIFGAVLFWIWPWMGARWDVFLSMPREAILLSFTAMMIGSIWFIALDVITMEGRARLFAVIMFLQSIIYAVTAVVALYAFHLHVLSLFVAQLAGAIVTFFGAVVVLRSYFRFIFDVRIFRKMLSMSLSTTPAQLAESLQVFIERSVLSIHVGFAQLGLYTHSQQYRSLVDLPIKAMARTVWPITLTESREKKADFPQTRQTWDIAYIGITIVGLLFASVGKDIISLLTHDKFTEANVLAAFWMVYLLLQHTGKPHTGVLFSLDDGVYYSQAMFVVSLISMTALLFLTPVFGLYGALFAMFARVFLFRVAINLRVKRHFHVPFQDGWVVIGSGFILSTLVVSTMVPMLFVGNVLIFLIFGTLFLFFARNILLNTLMKLLVAFS